MKKNLKSLKDYLRKLFTFNPYILLIFGLSFLFMSITLFDKIAWGHDYPFHIADVVGMDAFLRPMQGKIFPSKIIPFSAYNFGYGVGLFYPRLSHISVTYAYMFLKHIGLNAPQTMELVKMFVLFFSGVSMYVLMRKITKNDHISFISSISYMAAPYFLSDIYVRCALAEIFIFIFTPVSLIGLYELFFGKKHLFYIYFIIGYTGLILSHLVMTVYVTIFILIIFLFHIKKIFKWTYIKSLIISSIVILLLTSFFWMPMLEHKLFGNYGVFQDGLMTSNLLKGGQGLKIGQFFSLVRSRPSSGVYYGMNLGVLALALLSIIDRKKIFCDAKLRYVKTCVIIIIICSVILSLSIFPWEHMPSFLQMIQFPSRLLIFTILGISMLAGFGILYFPKGQEKLVVVIFTIIIVYLGMSSIPTDNVTFPNVPNDLDLWGMGAQHEYLPVKTLKNEDYLKNRKHEIYLKKGTAKTEIIEERIPILKANIELTSKEVTLELPRIYYLGYRILLKKDDDTVKNINYKENSNGFIEIKLKDSGLLEVDYPGTLINRIANISSVLTLFGCFIWLWYQRKSIKNI